MYMYTYVSVYVSIYIYIYICACMNQSKRCVLAETSPTKHSLGTIWMDMVVNGPTEALTLQHTATHYNTLQHTATLSGHPQHTATLSGHPTLDPIGSMSCFECRIPKVFTHACTYVVTHNSPLLYMCECRCIIWGRKKSDISQAIF